MSGLVTGAAKLAHAAAVSALSYSQVKVGGNLPNVALKLSGNAETADLRIATTPGKVIIVGRHVGRVGRWC